jgi:hypothetical protein
MTQEADQTNTAPETATTDTSAAASTASTADTSAASTTTAAPDTSAAPKNAFEAVKKVMEGDRAAAETAAGKSTATIASAPETKPDAAATTQDKTATDDKTAGGSRLTKEEFDALPPKAQARFNELYREAKTAQTQFERAKPVVQAFTDLQGWIGRQGMTQEEFTYGLTLIANAKNNPAKAYEMLQPLLGDLRKHVGEELPEDLAAEVEAGTLSKERAQELARRRNEEVLNADRTKRATAASEETRRVEAAQRMSTECASAIDGYEKQWRGSDPDYSKKKDMVWNKMVALMQTEGTPTSRDAAVELLKKARKEVEDWMRSFVPSRGAKETLPSGGANAQTKQQPTSALEAARLGLARVAA